MSWYHIRTFCKIPKFNRETPFRLCNNLKQSGEIISVVKIDKHHHSVQIKRKNTIRCETDIQIQTKALMCLSDSHLKKYLVKLPDITIPTQKVQSSKRHSILCRNKYFQESLNVMEFRIKYSYQTLWRIHLLNPPWRSCDRIISSNISSCDRLAEQPTEAQLAYCEHQRLELRSCMTFPMTSALSYCLQSSQLKATNIETTAK